MRPMPFLLFPAVALVAQAPANVDLVQRFNKELPGINQMLKELRTEEAIVKAQGLIPANPPAFNGATLQSIAMSLEDARGMGALHGLLAKATSAAGQWEKTLEIHEKRAQAARTTLANLEKAQAPISAQWKKVAQESGDYLAKNESRKKELEVKIAAFKAELEEIKTSKKKLSKKEVDEFNARGAQVQLDDQELAQITAAVPVHKQNLANAPKVTKLMADNRKDVEGLIKTADEAGSKVKSAIAAQNGEIADFNTKLIIKKVKIVGKKNWVDAVLLGTENITKQGGREEQAAFLNRLLVLDPGNAGAQKALDNLKAGKEAFAKEDKPVKKGSTKKKK